MIEILTAAAVFGFSLGFSQEMAKDLRCWFRWYRRAHRMGPPRGSYGPPQPLAGGSVATQTPAEECPECRVAQDMLARGYHSIHCNTCGCHWLSPQAAKALQKLSDNNDSTSPLSTP